MKTRTQKERVPFLANDVFTPTKPARATFVERQIINDKLVSALRTPGKQIVVYGHSGSGKTTLLVNKLQQIYSQHITTRCTSGLSFDQLVLDAFDQLGPIFAAEVLHTRETQQSAAVHAEYAGIKAQLGSQRSLNVQVRHQRILPPQLTPAALGRLMGAAGCCWVLEDFHKIDVTEKVQLAQAMKVFMDLADDFGELKIIAIGAVDSARQVVEYEHEMRNRVSEIFVPLMNAEEIEEIVNKGEHLLNFSVPFSVKKDIVKYSNGLASVCHQICLYICEAAEIVETLESHQDISRTNLKTAVDLYLENASDTLKSGFEKAFRRVRVRKYDNCRLILEALQQCDQDGATIAEILASIHKKTPGYPAANLTQYLGELTTEARGSLIRFSPSGGRYSFADPVYRAYAAALFEKQEAGSELVAIISDSMTSRVRELLRQWEMVDRKMRNTRIHTFKVNDT